MLKKFLMKQALKFKGMSADQAEAAYQLALEQAQHALSLPGVRGLHITDFRHDETLERLMRDLGRTPHQYT